MQKDIPAKWPSHAAVQPPGESNKRGSQKRELCSDDRNRFRQVSQLLHPDSGLCHPAETAVSERKTHICNHHVSDERSGKQSAGGDKRVSIKRSGMPCDRRQVYRTGKFGRKNRFNSESSRHPPDELHDDGAHPHTISGCGPEGH